MRTCRHVHLDVIVNDSFNYLFFVKKKIRRIVDLRRLSHVLSAVHIFFFLTKIKIGGGEIFNQRRSLRISKASSASLPIWFNFRLFKSIHWNEFYHQRITPTACLKYESFCEKLTSIPIWRYVVLISLGLPNIRPIGGPISHSDFQSNALICERHR